MVYHFALRATISHTKATSLIESILKKSSDFMYCFEGDNSDPKLPKEHLHFYVKTTHTLQSFRNTFHKHNLRGNGGFQCKQLECSPDIGAPFEYIAYMTKGDDYQHNLDNQLILDCVTHNAIVQSEIKERKKSKQKTFLTIIEDFKLDDHSTTEEIVHAVLDYHHKHDLLFSNFKIQGYCETIKYRLSLSFQIQYFERLVRNLNIQL